MTDTSAISVLLIAGFGWLAYEFGRQLYEAALHDTIRSGRSNNRRIRRAQDPEHFRNLVVVTIVLFGLFCAIAVWLFMGLVTG